MTLLLKASHEEHHSVVRYSELMAFVLVFYNVQHVFGVRNWCMVNQVLLLLLAAVVVLTSMQ